MTKLLGTGNPKTLKGQKKGYITFIMHLAPANASGYNVCPMASEGCKAACLNTAGRGRMKMIQDSRIRKTRWFFEDRDSFMEQLVKDIQAGIRKGNREDLVPVFRLNGTSDIRWETVPCVVDGTEYPNVMTAFPEIQFYDYTKLPNRKNIPDNYHLTFSRSEANDDQIQEAMSNGMNVAVVFSTKKGTELPETWNGIPVVDGDETDLRFIDPTNSIVGLRAKGDGKKDLTGFVVQITA